MIMCDEVGETYVFKARQGRTRQGTARQARQGKVTLSPGRVLRTPPCFLQGGRRWCEALASGRGAIRGGPWSFGKITQTVRSTLLREAKCQKSGVLRFAYLGTLCHKLSCVKSWPHKSAGVSTIIVFDALSDGNSPVAWFRAQPSFQATIFWKCRKMSKKW